MSLTDNDRPREKKPLDITPRVKCNNCGHLYYVDNEEFLIKTDQHGNLDKDELRGLLKRAKVVCPRCRHPGYSLHSHILN